MSGSANNLGNLPTFCWYRPMLLLYIVFLDEATCGKQTASRLSKTDSCGYKYSIYTSDDITEGLCNKLIYQKYV